jgi:hypothetical protein
MLKMLLDWFRTCWDFVITTVQAFAASAINAVSSILPGLDQGTFSDAKSKIAFAVSAANAWVPIDLAISLGAAYIVFVATYLGIKIAIKLIP